MTTTVKKGGQGQLGSSVATLYTAPSSAGNKAIIKEIALCNTDTATHTYTLYTVDSGGSAGVTNMLANAVPLAGGYTHILQISEVMEASGLLRGLADSASKITYTISVVEIT